MIRCLWRCCYWGCYPILLFTLGCVGTQSHSTHQFRLIGGHFYGPGPIVPDTALPDGYLRNIRFNLQSFSGYADFYNDGSAAAVLSDGKTKINQNIDAGVLDIGGQNKVYLAAVKGGPNRGREYYALADDYSFRWDVDLALDPGFAEGIVSVNNFILTTGLTKIALSVQTEQGIPGGYDQAGSLKSGEYLAGRVGDFDQNGYLDGIVVAAPRVPLTSSMLPGSPVGNQRGFTTDILIPPHLAGELALRGMALFAEPLDELVATNRVDEIVVLVKDLQDRIEAASGNLHRAMAFGELASGQLQQSGRVIADELETLRALNRISLNLIERYPHYGGKISHLGRDAIDRVFHQLKIIINQLSEANRRTAIKLPQKPAAFSLQGEMR